MKPMFFYRCALAPMLYAAGIALVGACADLPENPQDSNAMGMATSSPAEFLDRIKNAAPDEVRLNDIKRDKQWIIEGLAASNSRIAEYMRNLETVKGVKDTEVLIITPVQNHKKSAENFSFVIRVVLDETAKVEVARGSGLIGNDLKGAMMP